MPLHRRGTRILKVKDKIFYGWVIVAAALVILSVLTGVRFSFGVFFKSLQGEFDLTRAATSGVFSVYMVLSAIFSIVSGWASDRYGPRVVVCLMGLFIGLSLLITSQANAFWQLFLSYSLLLAIGTAGTIPVVVTTVSRWFDKKRGVAIGIATSGAGLGTLVVAPFAAYLISDFGWRISYIIIGLVAWFVVISMAMLLRRDPGEMGVLPDGIKSSGRTELVDREGSLQLVGLSLMQALRTRNFWLILAIWLLFGFCISLILTHVVPYATDIGVSIIEAATILSVISGFSILSRILVGRISDTVGRKIPGIICAMFGAGALVWLIGSHSLWMFYLFAVPFGFYYGGLGVSSLAMASDFFRGPSLGKIMGALEVGFLIGSAIGSVLGGFIFDVTGSYSMAFVIGTVAILMTGLFVSLTGERQTPDTGW